MPPRTETRTGRLPIIASKQSYRPRLVAWFKSTSAGGEKRPEFMISVRSLCNCEYPASNSVRRAVPGCFRLQTFVPHSGGGNSGIVTALEFRLNTSPPCLVESSCARALWPSIRFGSIETRLSQAPDELTPYAALLVKGLSYFCRRLDDGISDGGERFCILPFRASALGSVVAHPATVTSSSLRPSPYCMFQY
jgi:hypothetical protein